MGCAHGSFRQLETLQAFGPIGYEGIYILRVVLNESYDRRINSLYQYCS